MADGLNMSRRLRRTPYTDRVEAAGVTGFSVVNHMLLPKAFQHSIEEDYWHLRSQVQIWDVSCQRQVEITGPDASRLVQWMTPRDLRDAQSGQCLYIPITDHTAGMINDPVLLKLDDQRYWLSIADSDLLLYAQGLAIGANLQVEITEPDVSPLAVQGPKAAAIMEELFGPDIHQLKFFGFQYVKFAGTRQLIARSGYSRQGGFEIYLNDSALGSTLWDAIWQAGQHHGIRPGCPNLIERIEGGLLSYGNEMTRQTNPLELGMRRLCSLDGSVNYIGRDALEKIDRDGVQRQIRGVRFGETKCPTCAVPWAVRVADRTIGHLTSAIWSPRLQQNVGLAMMNTDGSQPGMVVDIFSADGSTWSGEISLLPFD